MSASLFTAVEMAPRDPILGMNEQFNADPNPHKVNLGVGVYFNDEGKLPVLRCVAAAEKLLLETPKAKGYLPIDGIAAYDKAVQGLVFGADHPAVTGGLIATVQGLGGTGGLKVGADFLKKLNPGSQVLISDPSWENHRRSCTARPPAPTARPTDRSRSGCGSRRAARPRCSAPRRASRPASHRSGCRVWRRRSTGRPAPQSRPA